ncbi:uncharacterized protein LOC134752948 isoform X3 [Cydia strobilella]|uniref:uncharacterized protein LOC134752948 isoform X3 n=1 Tax=Cydia strobilella TaxID=1100964 RepID=UPI003007113F
MLYLQFSLFPHDPDVKEKWIASTGRKDWFPTKHSTICSIHFENTCFIEGKKLRLLKKTACPTIDILKLIDNDDETEPTAPLIAQPSPGPSQSTDTLDSDASTEELQEPLRQVFSVSNESTKPEDPLRQDTKQCRFCGKYSKDCVPISHTHIASFTTKLAFNDIVVQFNETLPKTVCKDCDVKLQVIYDFVKYAKAAQELLINVEDVEEMVEVKHEYDDETYDRLEDSNSDEEIKDGIVDLFTVGETVYIKENQKRKSIVISGVKLKKAKVTKSETGNESKNMSDTKEVIDRDDTNNEADNDNIGFSSNDTRTNKPNDAKFAKRVFVHKVRIDGNS